MSEHPIPPTAPPAHPREVRIPCGRGYLCLRALGRGEWMAHMDDTGMYLMSAPVTEKALMELARGISTFLADEEREAAKREESYD